MKHPCRKACTVHFYQNTHDLQNLIKAPVYTQAFFSTTEKKPLTQQTRTHTKYIQQLKNSISAGFWIDVRMSFNTMALLWYFILCEKLSTE